MEDVFTILGISISEFIAIAALLILFFNPDEITEISSIIGGAIRRILRSSVFDYIRKAGQDINSIPSKLVRDESFENIKRDLADLTDSDDLPSVRATFREIQRSATNPPNPPMADDGETR